MKKENEFDRLLVKIIDNSLREVFDKNATSAIYAYLENNYAINQKEIPEKLDLFSDGLHNFLSTGAFVIEQAILDKLCINLKCAHELELDPENDFKNSIIQLKISLKLK